MNEILCTLFICEDGSIANIDSDTALYLTIAIYFIMIFCYFAFLAADNNKIDDHVLMVALMLVPSGVLGLLSYGVLWSIINHPVQLAYVLAVLLAFVVNIVVARYVRKKREL